MDEVQQPLRSRISFCDQARNSHQSCGVLRGLVASRALLRSFAYWPAIRPTLTTGIDVP
jgi:hypothetical protein